MNYLWRQVGGKNFQKSMEHVNKFVTDVIGRSEEVGFNRAAAFFDENYEATDKYIQNLFSTSAECTDGNYLKNYLFSVFSSNQYHFYNISIWKNVGPSSIWRRDSNPRSLEPESSPITTRPGLPPFRQQLLRHLLIISFTSFCAIVFKQDIIDICL